MRKLLLALLSFISIYALNSCTKEGFDKDDDKRSGIIESITVNLPKPHEIDTRSTFVIDNSGVHVLWAEKDTVGILPSSGDQVSFPMVSGAGSNSADFNGGSWGLKDNNTYSAYYPFNKKYYQSSHDAIRLSWEGQVQTGNNNASHMGAFDFLASGAAAPSGQYLTIDFSRLGAIACFKVNVPNPGTYDTAQVTTDGNFVLEADLDVTGNSPIVTPVTTTQTISLGLKQITTTQANEVVTLYMMMYPVDLTGHSVFIALTGKDHSFTASLPTKNMVAGKPYMFQAGEATSAISFADQLVKEICVSNWDTNNNGFLEFEEAQSVTQIGAVFQGKRITAFDELQYFSSLSSLPNNAFNNCESLVSITLPDNIMALGTDIFNNCKALQEIALPDGIESIPERAFQNCQSLKSITIPSSVTSIGNYALDGARQLESLTLPVALQSLGDYALRGLASIESISLPGGISSLGVNTFDGWTSLKSILIPSNWTKLPDCAFSACSSLESIVVPENITHIGQSCFDGCLSLASITLPDNLSYIESYAFKNCSSLVSITLPENLNNTLSHYALFAGCSKLETVNIPSAWSELGDGYFNGCKALKSIIIPEGIVRIGGGCFSGCTSLESVSLPQSLLRIDEFSFEGCTSLESIVIPGRIKSIEQGIFMNCTALTSITLPLGLIAIGSKTDTSGPFVNCTSLKSILIPQTVSYIGTYAFFGAGLESVTIPNSVTFLGLCAFERCYHLTNITLSSNLTILDNGLFFGVPLTNLTIPAKVESIMQIHLGNVEKITLLGTTPPALFNASVIPANDCPIIVPAEAVNTYKSAPVWSNFSSRIQANADSGGNNPDPGEWE